MTCDKGEISDYRGGEEGRGRAEGKRRRGWKERVNEEEGRRGRIDTDEKRLKTIGWERRAKQKWERK